MAFIKATWGEAEIAINVEKIVAVVNNRGQAVVHTNGPPGTSSNHYFLKDNYETIIHLIETATDESMT